MWILKFVNLLWKWKIWFEIVCLKFDLFKVVDLLYYNNIILNFNFVLCGSVCFCLKIFKFYMIIIYWWVINRVCYDV